MDDPLAMFLHFVQLVENALRVFRNDIRVNAVFGQPGEDVLDAHFVLFFVVAFVRHVSRR